LSGKEAERVKKKKEKKWSEIITRKITAKKKAYVP
jgi:hypothetical protein